MKKLIFLVGVKHSGKSTVGKELAASMCIPFIDIDTEIEREAEMPVRQLFLTKGETAFKHAEATVCAQLAKTNQPCVIATGGGLCSNPEAVTVIQEAKTHGKAVIVMLNADETTVCDRIIANSRERGSYPPYIAKHNPKTTEDVRRIFKPIYEERTALYQEMCDFCIDTAQKTPQQISLEIQRTLSKARLH